MYWFLKKSPTVTISLISRLISTLMTLGADPYLPRGLIESFLRVFKHFALKIPRGKVWVFFFKNLGVKIKKTQGVNLKKPGGFFFGFSLKKP